MRHALHGGMKHTEEEELREGREEESEPAENEVMRTSLEVFQAALLLPPTGAGFNTPLPVVPPSYPGESSPYENLDCPPELTPASCREMIARLRVQNLTPHRIRSVRVAVEQQVTIRVATTTSSEGGPRPSPYRPPPPPKPPYHVSVQTIPVAAAEYVPDSGLLLPGEDITFEVCLRGPRGIATTEARAQLPIPSLHTPLCFTSTSLQVSYPAIRTRLPDPFIVKHMPLISSYVDDTNQVPANLEYMATL